MLPKWVFVLGAFLGVIEFATSWPLMPTASRWTVVIGIAGVVLYAMSIDMIRRLR